jgi:hypothetical protein
MLEKERAFYEAHKDEFLEHYEGQWVLIHGDALLGAYTTERQAFEAGVEKLGNVAMLVRLVRRGPEPVISFPRLQS